MIPSFIKTMEGVFGKLTHVEKEMIFINDGCTDDTLEVLLRSQTMYPELIVLELSRNFGKVAALTAGLRGRLNEAVMSSLPSIARTVRPLITLLLSPCSASGWSKSFPLEDLWK